jgi:hypothetical protein
MKSINYVGLLYAMSQKYFFYFIYELFTTLKIISIKVVSLNNINTPMRYVEIFSTR